MFFNPLIADEVARLLTLDERLSSCHVTSTCCSANQHLRHVIWSSSPSNTDNIKGKILLYVFFHLFLWWYRYYSDLFMFQVAFTISICCSSFLSFSRVQFTHNLPSPPIIFSFVVAWPKPLWMHPQVARPNRPTCTTIRSCSWPHPWFTHSSPLSKTWTDGTTASTSLVSFLWILLTKISSCCLSFLVLMQSLCWLNGGDRVVFNKTSSPISCC